MIDHEINRAIRDLRKYRDRLTPQQMRTIKGQILAGDIAGARKGLWKLLNKQEKERTNK